MGCSNRLTDLVIFLSENCCNTVPRWQDVAQIHQALCRRQWVTGVISVFGWPQHKSLSSPLQFSVCEESKPQVLWHLKSLGGHRSWMSWATGHPRAWAASAVPAVPTGLPVHPHVRGPHRGQTGRNVDQSQSSGEPGAVNWWDAEWWYVHNSVLSFGPKTKLLLIREENKILEYSTLYLKQFPAHFSLYPQDSYVKEAGHYLPLHRWNSWCRWKGFFLSEARRK